LPCYEGPHSKPAVSSRVLENHTSGTDICDVTVNAGGVAQSRALKQCGGGDSVRSQVHALLCDRGWSLR